jgi:hypothetical protein
MLLTSAIVLTASSSAFSQVYFAPAAPSIFPMIQLYVPATPPVVAPAVKTTIERYYFMPQTSSNQPANSTQSLGVGSAFRGPTITAGQKPEVIIREYYIVENQRVVPTWSDAPEKLIAPEWKDEYELAPEATSTPQKPVEADVLPTGPSIPASVPPAGS